MEITSSCFQIGIRQFIYQLKIYYLSEMHEKLLPVLAIGVPVHSSRHFFTTTTTTTVLFVFAFRNNYFDSSSNNDRAD